MPGEAQTHLHLKRPSQFHADGSRKKPRTEIEAETPADEEMAEAYPEAETKPLRGARATGFPPWGRRVQRRLSAATPRNAPPPSPPPPRADLLTRMTLRDVVGDKPAAGGVLTLEHNASIADALGALARRGVLSAPLVMSPDLEDFPAAGTGAGEPGGPPLLGWVDVNDVLAGLLAHLEEHSPAAGTPTTREALSRELSRRGPEFLGRLLVTLAGGHDRSLLYTPDLGRPALDVIDRVFLGHEPVPRGPLADPGDARRVVHRAAVFDGRGEVTHVLTQGDVVRFLHRNIGRVGGWASRALFQSGVLDGRGPVVAVEAGQPAALALKLVHESGHSAAAVLDGNGALVGSLSSSDLRALTARDLSVLALPCGLFLAMLRQRRVAGYSPDGGADGGADGGGGVAGFFRSSARARAASGREGPGAGAGAATCTPQSTLGEVIALMASGGTRHVWVSDSAGGVIAVVTPTDVLREASRACKAGRDRFESLRASFEGEYKRALAREDAETLARLLAVARGRLVEA